MSYILNERYRLRGWYKLPNGLFDTWKKEAEFPEQGVYLLLMKCDGAHALAPETLSDQEKEILKDLEKKKNHPSCPFLGNPEAGTGLSDLSRAIPGGGPLVRNRRLQPEMPALFYVRAAGQTRFSLS